MWGEAGHAYVYFTYGMHHCLNVVAQQPGEPEAVLIRAIEPAKGSELMQQRRNARQATQVGSGPAKLCQAMNIDRSLDKTDLVTGDSLWLERLRQRAVPRTRLAVTPRIGIDYAEEWADALLRFTLAGSPHLSRR
jgi:DNA-3-methyladenine glycosylase